MANSKDIRIEDYNEFETLIQRLYQRYDTRVTSKAIKLFLLDLDKFEELEHFYFNITSLMEKTDLSLYKSNSKIMQLQKKGII